MTGLCVPQLCSAQSDAFGLFRGAIQAVEDEGAVKRAQACGNFGCAADYGKERSGGLEGLALDELRCVSALQVAHAALHFELFIGRGVHAQWHRQEAKTGAWAWDGLLAIMHYI